MSFTPTIINLRDAIYSRIVGCKNTLAITDLDIVATYYPTIKLQDLIKPKISIIAMQWSEEKLSRVSTREMGLPVQIALQAKVVPTDTPTIDLLICLVEQLNQICAKFDKDPYMWMNTQPMQDPNGTALGFMELHEQHLFQATFTAFYKATVC